MLCKANKYLRKLFILTPKTLQSFKNLKKAFTNPSLIKHFNSKKLILV